MQSCHILALHGFLGSGQDWQAIEKVLTRKTEQPVRWIKPDLFSKEDSINLGDLDSYNSLIEKLIWQLPTSSNKIFIGYSLGARVGLHLLENYSEYFRAFVFLGAHPGLINADEIKQRSQSDYQWKKKLQTLPWDDFWQQWTAQPVFKGDRAVIKSGSAFNLQKLSKGLTSLSLAAQTNKNDVIKKNKNKIYWCVGAKDSKFLMIAQDLTQKKILSGYERIFESGHRILFDQPELVADLLKNLID